MPKKIGKIAILIALGLLASESSYALTGPESTAVKNALPGSTEPAVISNTLSASQREPVNPRALPPVKTPQQEPSSLGPQATQIKFVLKQIVLEGNHVYTNQQLEAIYKDKIDTEISVAELQNIVQDITNYYRNNGYVLSRAILPPQHVENGIVRVKIIEGYINNVNVIGVPKGAREMIQDYGKQIIKSRPLKLSVMEYYLRLANEIPGVEVKAVLEPSKDQVGASDLNLSAEAKTLTGSFSYDNYGTRYIGPNQDTLNASLNSIFISGDATRLIYATTTRPTNLKFYDISYESYVNSYGTTVTLGKNNSLTEPGLDLAIIDINGSSSTYYLSLQHPLLRTRTKNLTLDAGFNYLDSQVLSFSSLIYNDHIRSLKFGGNYDFADSYGGTNSIALHAEQGFNILGASNNPNSTTTSRFGATGVYTRFMGQAARLQHIYSKLSAFLLANGQYSFNPLLSAEQVGYGGSQLGRGYDPAEIIGDRGVGGSIELRLDFAPEWHYLQTIEPYVFYDAGEIWNIKNVVGIKQKQSLTSTGLGTRFTLGPYIFGNLMLAQPLTKSVAAEEVVGRGRNLRGFFSLVASV